MVILFILMSMAKHDNYKNAKIVIMFHFNEYG